MKLSSIICLHIVVLLWLSPISESLKTNRKTLLYADAPADNPLRGLVPYDSASARTRFPHSMEFAYLSLKDLMTGMNSFNWQPLDDKLTQAQSRGMQFNFRVWLEYPKEESGLPDFLKSQVTVTSWAESSGTVNFTPDYEAPALRDALKSFIAALGSRYDSNNAIGFIHAGLLGKWGEWHTYPETSRMASQQVQKEVMDAFKKAFRKKKIMLRYPGTSNADEPFGYLDDSFGYSTLYEDSSTPSWYYSNLMRQSGATEKWKTFPIGGEIFPGLWETVFTPNYKGQDFTVCVAQTHASWMRDAAMFSTKYNVDAARLSAATAEVSKMGYTLHVQTAVKTGKGIGMVQLMLVLKNTGVAPFYYDWPVYIRASTESTEHAVPEWKLSEVLPGTGVWMVRIVDAPMYTIRVPNPMPGGKPLRFANADQFGDELRIAFD